MNEFRFVILNYNFKQSTPGESGTIKMLLDTRVVGYLIVFASGYDRLSFPFYTRFIRTANCAFHFGELVAILRYQIRESGVGHMKIAKRNCVTKRTQ